MLYLAEALIAPAAPGHPHRVGPGVGRPQGLSLLLAEDELAAGGHVQRLYAGRLLPRDLAPFLLVELPLLQHLIPRLR